MLEFYTSITPARSSPRPQTAIPTINSTRYRNNNER